MKIETLINPLTDKGDICDPPWQDLSQNQSESAQLKEAQIAELLFDN